MSDEPITATEIAERAQRFEEAWNSAGMDEILNAWRNAVLDPMIERMRSELVKRGIEMPQLAKTEE